MQFFKQLLSLLSSSERKYAFFLLIMLIMMAFLDMIGVASILPFLAIISNPSLIETNFFLKFLFEISSVFGIKNNKEFLFFLGILMFIILIFSLSFKAFTNYILARFSQETGHGISIRLLERYINQPYSWFLSRNSSELGKTILSEVGLIVSGGLIPIFNLLSNCFVAIFLLALLFFVDIKLALSVVFVLGGAYFLIFSYFRKLIDRIGKERLIANKLRFKSITEVFGGSKEIKLGGLEKFYVERFSESSFIFFKNQITIQIITNLPRYFIEAISFGGILLIILYNILKTGSFNNSIPIIGVYAFAGYRLIPSLQSIYQSIGLLKFSNATISKTYNDFKNLKLYDLAKTKNTLSFNDAITLNQIHYEYPNSSRTVLKDINLTIPARTTVGLIGPTGCGKSTIVDIILGLLEPKKGMLKIDGEVINNDNRKSWQSYVGYVPQQIYLSDETIAANIAFGIDPKDINQNMVEKVSKIANLHQFVFDELPNKYQTIVGERGVRLSGGQRQRIAIARALYRNPKVLILDEATSALDNQTEKVVMEAVNTLGKKITIILIAHRLNTLRNCDIIYKIDKGQVIDQGTFKNLVIEDTND